MTRANKVTKANEKGASNEASNANAFFDANDEGGLFDVVDAGGLNDGANASEAFIAGVTITAAEVSNVFDAVNEADAHLHQSSPQPKSNAAKPAPALKGPKDPLDILKSFGSEKAAVALVLKLSAQGLSVQYCQPDTGPWQVRIRRVGFPVQTETFTTRKAAKAWATLREAEFIKGETVDYSQAKRVTLGQLLLRYRDALPKDLLSDNSLWHRLTKISRHPVCEYSMNLLRPTHIAQYRDDRLKEVKPATVVADLSYISSIIGHARREWDIAMPRNVATTEFVKRPRIGADGERTRRLEKVEGEVPEEQRFFEALMEVRNLSARAFIVVALETGIRRAELLRLKWDRVFFADKYIALTAGTTKNKHARQAALTPLAINALNSLERIGELVFEGETRDTIKCCFRRLRERAGLTDFRMHDLRHEFTSRLFEETTLRETEIQFFTGHRDLRMLTRYSHLRPDFMIRRLEQAREEMKTLKQLDPREAGEAA
jgi:integrase